MEIKAAPEAAGHRPKLARAGHPALVVDDRGSPLAEDDSAPFTLQTADDAGRPEGRPEMREFDELVVSPGVLMAGRFGADGRVAEHKTTGLYIERPALTRIVQ